MNCIKYLCVQHIYAGYITAQCTFSNITGHSQGSGEEDHNGRCTEGGERKPGENEVVATATLVF